MSDYLKGVSGFQLYVAVITSKLRWKAIFDIRGLGL